MDWIEVGTKKKQTPLPSPDRNQTPKHTNINKISVPNSKKKRINIGTSIPVPPPTNQQLQPDTADNK
jgi:hypothetical protein